MLCETGLVALINSSRVIYRFLFLFCHLMKSVFVSIVMPVSANGLGISLGFAVFLIKVRYVRAAVRGWSAGTHAAVTSTSRTRRR